MKELISVVIPAYNVGDQIRRCLDSVLAQRYKNIEVILVDDGSDDETPAICDEYAGRDDRVRVVHKANDGVASARNKALDLAEGEMIGFADADDYMEPDMLRILHEHLVREKADMASCGYYEEYTDKSEMKRMGSGVQVLDKEAAYGDFFRMGGRLGSGCWNKLIRSSVLSDIRYKKYTMGEDVELLSRALDKCDRVVCVDYPGYHYVHRQDSATQAVFRPANMDIIHVVEEMAGYISERHPELTEQMYGFHASWHFATLQVLFNSGGKRAHPAEAGELKQSVRANMPDYLDNPYVYRVEKILLWCFAHNCFGPVYPVYELLFKLRHGRKVW